MNLPDHSEDVAGVDEPAAADLEALGVPADTDNRIRAVRSRVHWKARAMKAETDARLERERADTWRWIAHVFGAVAGILIIVAIVAAAK